MLTKRELAIVEVRNHCDNGDPLYGLLHFTSPGGSAELGHFFHEPETGLTKIAFYNSTSMSTQLVKAFINGIEKLIKRD